MFFKNKGDSREEFLKFVAEALMMSAPGEEQKDNLHATLLGAHQHRRVGGFSIDGANLSKLGIVEVLDEKHGWIVGTIDASQEAWKRVHKGLPLDLLKDSTYLQDLGNKVSEIERESFKDPGISKR